MNASKLRCSTLNGTHNRNHKVKMPFKAASLIPQSLSRRLRMVETDGLLKNGFVNLVPAVDARASSYIASETGPKRQAVICKP